MSKGSHLKAAQGQFSSAQIEASITSLWLLLSLLAYPYSSVAQLAIDVSDITLEPNQPDQVVEVILENDGSPLPVTGIGLNVQVTDTGPMLAGSIAGPKISHVDVFAGTIFENNNNGTSGAGAFDGGQLFSTGTLTRTGTVEIPPSFSTLASITFDTTGFFDGDYTFTFDTLNGSVFYTTSGHDIQVEPGPSGMLSIRSPREPATEVEVPALEIGYDALGQLMLTLPNGSSPNGQLQIREQLHGSPWRDVEPNDPNIVHDPESAPRWQLTPRGAANFFRWVPNTSSP